MSFFLKFGDNAALVIGCGIIVLVAMVFFILVYVADFKDSRRKAKKKRDFERPSPAPIAVVRKPADPNGP
jgi:hypothetical protein